MKEFSERDYEQGRRAALRSMLGECLQGLDVDDPVRQGAAWVAERTAAIAMLRRVCYKHGDNDWPDDLHLADVIEKHLAVYLADEE